MEETCEHALSSYRLLQPHLEQDQTLHSVAEQAGILFRTLQRWMAQHHQSGLVSLVREGRQDAGGRLLSRLLSQTKRVLEINGLKNLSKKLWKQPRELGDRRRLAPIRRFTDR